MSEGRPVDAAVHALAEAVWQVLDDMGAGKRTSCSPYAKAALRVAYEPFRVAEDAMDRTLEEAKAIINDVTHG